jgi:hypothetical protein
VVAAGGSSGSTSGAKKPRLIASQTTSHTSTSNTTPPRSFDTTSSHQGLSLLFFIHNRFSKNKYSDVWNHGEFVRIAELWSLCDFLK